jgi:hypothetical protein
MAKFHGKIGYVKTVESETAPGVFDQVVTEYSYSGDVIRDTRRWERSNNLNDNLNISNTFSVVGDWYSYDNFSQMRYIEYLGTKWKITNVEVQRPRLILTVGGVYNGA